MFFDLVIHLSGRGTDCICLRHLTKWEDQFGPGMRGLYRDFLEEKWLERWLL